MLRLERRLLILGLIGLVHPLLGTASSSAPAPAASQPWSRRVFNLKDFGAKGDGTTNDTAAFQAAAKAVTEAGGGVLVIPKATYVVGRQIHEDGKYPYYQVQPIFSVTGLDGVTVEGGGATIRIADGLRYGSFDKDTGEPYQPAKSPFTDYRYAASAYWGIFVFQECRNVVVRDLELDGNCGKLVLGGPFGDTGRQVGAYGLAFYRSRDVRVENVHTHHHGLDGLVIGWAKLKETDPATPHLLVNVVSEYNGRQGLSWVGGRGVTAVNCKFNHTGRAGIASAPGAGLDIEAEESICRDGLFVNCEFVDNTGCGVVADSGDGGYSRFVNCLIWGTTSWSTWSAKPGLVFEDCTIHGSAVHGVGSDKPELATRYLRCRFEDVDYSAERGCYRSNGGLVECGGGNNILFDACTFIANQCRGAWIDGTNTREIIRGCRFLHRVQMKTDHDFVSLLRGCRIENTVFAEDYPKGFPARYFIAVENPSVGPGVWVEGPVVKWANWSWGTAGPIAPTPAKD